MDILKPPTDNLYKFISIFGLLIFLASFIFPQILSREYSLKYAEVEGEIRVLENEREYIDNLKSDSEEPNQKKEDDPAIKQREAEFDKGLAEARKNHELSKALGVEARRWQWFGYIGMLLGVALMAGGFYLWYSRVQKYEDKLMKYKADEASNQHIP